jgi:transketolase
MTAAHYKLDNLTAIVDRNTLQITGRTEEVNGLEPLADKFRAFGFVVREADGHDVGQLARVLESVPFEAGRPSVVLARTTKGKGVSFMEDAKNWHHKVPTAEQYEQAQAELDAARAALLEVTA